MLRMCRFNLEIRGYKKQCLFVPYSDLFYSNLQVCIYVNAKLLFLYVLIVV